MMNYRQTCQPVVESFGIATAFECSGIQTEPNHWYHRVREMILLRSRTEYVRGPGLVDDDVIDVRMFFGCVPVCSRSGPPVLVVLSKTPLVIMRRHIILHFSYARLP